MSEREAYGVLLAELESSRLEVVLVPCRRTVNAGGCIRVAVSKNAEWYRRFCARHGSGRYRKNALFDTKIRRANIVRVLGRLAAGEMSRSKYAHELRAWAEKIRLTWANKAAC